MIEPIEIIPSSGNVFADLGMSNPELRLEKATLVVELRRAIKAKGLKNPRAAKKLGLSTIDLRRTLLGLNDDYTPDQLRGYIETIKSGKESL